MNATDLLKWHYMIFLLPFGVSALLLLLSALRLGGHHGGHGGHGGMHAHGHAGGHTAGHTHTAHGGLHRVGTTAHGPKGGHDAKAAHTTKAHSAQKAGTDEDKTRPHVTINTHFIWNLSGLNRAPLTMVLEAFALVWGLCGYWANRLLLHEAAPTPGKLLPSLLIALVGGIIGARIAAEIIGRMMPQDETLAVSRSSLFGLTGTVAFAVSETSGRICIYDTFGSLHDETCRVEAGHPPIAKGRRAMVMDMDGQGKLLVEEVPDGTP